MATCSVDVDSDSTVTTNNLSLNSCSSVESVSDNVIYVEETIEENGERETVLQPVYIGTQFEPDSNWFDFSRSVNAN